MCDGYKATGVTIGIGIGIGIVSKQSKQSKQSKASKQSKKLAYLLAAYNMIGY